MASPPSSPLQFVPFTSAPDVGFWKELGRRKLDEFGLDEAPVPVWGHYEVTSHGRSAGVVAIGGNAFAGGHAVATAAGPGSYPVQGTVLNLNTLEAFKSLDKNKLMEAEAAHLRAAVATQDGRGLARVLVLTFADLKTHEYYYWFAFPALAPARPFVATPAVPLEAALAPLSVGALGDALAAAEARLAGVRGGDSGGDGGGSAPASRDLAFFVARASARGLVVGESGGVADERGAFEVSSLEQWSAWCADAAQGVRGAPLLCMRDPTLDPAHPGWPLRNLLMWVRAQEGTPQYVHVVCWREAPGSRSASAPASAPGAAMAPRSISLRVRVLPDPESGEATTSLPQAVGWERNARGKLGARMVTLRAQLDPHALAESSVDLNLRLMRWRLLPELDTERLAATRCLLVGAGTLGCNVARALLAWGVRTITFVDGGSVSHSNPVRQSLFTFADVAGDGRKAKAPAAAAAVSAIFPGAKATGHELHIPMPGHAVTPAEEAAVRAAAQRLDALVEAHDAIFLLTDTRESRWLPALLCAAKGRLAITAALGFDSYVVMRHGRGPAVGAAPHVEAGGAGDAAGATAAGEVAAAADADNASRLGCYFCNDVVAPTDSTRDRTLDQQCTVTRPGLSMVASSLAVEMLVTVLHHADGLGAPPDSLGGDASTPLGLLPHQVRGFLPSFRTELLRGQAFGCCVACSARAVGAYHERGFDFLLRAFNEPGYLEEFSGLKDLQDRAQAALEAWDGDEEDEDDAGDML